MVVLGGGAVFYERGTPVILRGLTPSRLEPLSLRSDVISSIKILSFHLRAVFEPRGDAQRCTSHTSETLLELYRMALLGR